MTIGSACRHKGQIDGAAEGHRLESLQGKPDGKGSHVHSIESIHAALLMDIRDELKELNRRLRNLENLSVSIRRNTAWSRKKQGT